MKTSDLASFMARKVSPFLTVEVQGGTWSVKGLPGLLVGDRVMCLLPAVATRRVAGQGAAA